MVKVIKNFFSKVECDQLKNFVLSHRKDWIVYKDNKETDHALIVYGNNFLRILLKNKFDKSKTQIEYESGLTIEHEWLYDILSQRIGTLLNKEVRYVDNFAKPGFHIFLQTDPRVWHYDDEKPHYPYRKSFKGYDNFSYFDRVYTMTITLSSGEFTYDYFPETYSKYSENAPMYCKTHHGLQGDECGECDLTKYETVKYSVGDLILTEDRYIHRVGSSKYVNDNERITIQGHIVIKDNIVYMYW